MMRAQHLFVSFVLGFCLCSSVGAKDEKPPAKTEKGAKDKKAKDKKDKNVEVREDRIKSIQRKDFLKRHRWAVSPMVTLSLNDAFYQKAGGGAALAFHPADSLGLEIQGVYIGTVQTDMVGYYQQANQALPKVSNLRFYMTGNLLWSPLYGKLSLFTDDIVHFDAYLIAGFGMAYTETGAKFATNLGLGLRYFLASWFVIKLEVRDLIYTETFTLDVQRTEFSDIQNHVMFSVGVSFYLPLDFDYEYQ